MAKSVYYAQSGAFTDNVDEVATVVVVLSKDEVTQGSVDVNGTEFKVHPDVAKNFGAIDAPAVVENPTDEGHVETKKKK